MPSLKITLNGTGKNPWHGMGLDYNPFHQFSRMETDAAERRLAQLAMPIADAAHIRGHLKGYFSEEFIELCCAQFIPGAMVKFTVEWKE
jgi:hypothetical protein